MKSQYYKTSYDDENTYLIDKSASYSYNNRINAIICIDTETIIEKYGINLNPRYPIQVTGSYICRITSNDRVISGEIGEELSIRAEIQRLFLAIKCSRARSRSLSVPVHDSG